MDFTNANPRNDRDGGPAVMPPTKIYEDATLIVEAQPGRVIVTNKLSGWSATLTASPDGLWKLDRVE